jgi:hypothetical protein
VSHTSRPNATDARMYVPGNLNMWRDGLLLDRVLRVAGTNFVGEASSYHTGRVPELSLTLKCLRGGPQIQKRSVGVRS